MKILTYLSTKIKQSKTNTTLQTKVYLFKHASGHIIGRKEMIFSWTQ